MRHKKKVNHLGRKSEHRKAMLSNMAASLILQKRITTTLAKAKALKVYVEPLITKSKEDSTHSRRTVFSYLQNKVAVSELFREVSQKVADRPGGYTRILKTGFRKGDGAEMCFIELVDYNLNMLKTSEDSQKKTRRSRRGKKASETGDKPVAPTAKAKTAEPKAEDVKAAEQEEEVVAQAEVVEQEVSDEVTTEDQTTEAETPVAEKQEEVKDEVKKEVAPGKKQDEASDEKKDKKEE
jgi:large subunit ribosomal protein L17